MKINLHIERLVLHGLPLEQRDGARLQAAVERELARLLTDGRLPTQAGGGGSMASVRGRSIQLAERAEPVGLGEQIAGAVHDGLGGGS